MEMQGISFIAQPRAALVGQRRKSTVYYRMSAVYLALYSAAGLTAALFAAPAQAAEDQDYVEFNAGFLQGSNGGQRIDLSRFSYGNPIAAGEYYADVYLNGALKGRLPLRFADIGDAEGTAKRGATLCLTDELAALLDVKSEAMHGSSAAEHGCVSLTQRIPDMKIDFDMGNLRLDTEIPQAMVVTRPRGYISPAQWQTGVPVAFVNYDASNYDYRTGDSKMNQTYLGIRAGVNIGPWALRHRGSQSWVDNVRSDYSKIETYVERDIAALRAQLTLGDFSTGGELLDSISLRGARLRSDDRMLPGSLRGYAPTVRGVAYSNARVTIHQGGNLIYETVVPAGSFEITDLYPSGYGGDLDVTITEADGTSRTFSVPFASVAQLIRPGYSRYQLSWGRYREGDKIYSGNIVQGTLQYGLTNDVTLNTGFSIAPNYQSGLLGVAFNTPIGAIATDITLSRTRFLNSGNSKKGYSLHASYSVSVPSTRTNLTLAAYRYSSQDFYRLSDAMQANHSQFLDEVNIKMLSYRRPKNQLQLSVSQNLGKDRGNLYLVGSSYQYWGSHKGSNEYQVGYSNRYRKVNYQLAYSQSRDLASNRSDNRISLSFSIPLGGGSQRPSLSTSMNYQKYGNSGMQVSLSGTAGKYDQMSYGVSGNAQQDGERNYSLNAGYRSSFNHMQATYGGNGKGNRQYSLSASGAVVAHPHGITLSNELSDTFTIIHAKGAAGATINNAPGNRLDYFGNGIVPYVSAYQKNYVSIDPSELPLDVEVAATEQEIIPRANSAILVNFSTKSGKAVLFDLQPQGDDGKLPPMASEVYDQAGNSVGFVGQGGRMLVKGIDDSGKLTIVWGENQAERCEIAYDLAKSANGSDSQLGNIQHNNAVCR